MRRRPKFREPPFTYDQILAWADAFYQSRGRWPTARAGRIVGGLGVTWMAVDMALSKGHRGLPGGTTLAKLLAECRGHRHHFMTPRLSRKRILAWADSHRGRTGAWPTRSSGPVADAPGETWSAIDRALHTGTRGLQGRSSLAELLARRRGRRNVRALPHLTAGQIVTWAEAHHTLFLEWPTTHSGPIGNTGETWLRVDAALRQGKRGLPGGDSLYQLLRRRGKFSGTRTPRRQ